MKAIGARASGGKPSPSRQARQGPDRTGKGGDTGQKNPGGGRPRNLANLEASRAKKALVTKPITLADAKAVFAKYLELDDWTVLDVIFGVVLVHRLPGDPLWLFVVGPPGGVKTELLRTLSGHHDVYAVSTLTPRAMISGYETDGDDPSLLPKLNQKVLVVKDFTTILQMEHTARQEVISTLRDVYDGEAAKAFGTGVTKAYTSRFGMLAAVTPVIDDFSAINAMLGERFLRFRLSTGDTLSKIKRALENTANEVVIRKELSRAALGVLAQAPPTPKVPDVINTKLMHLANFLALSRSEVSHDHKGVVAYVPVPEIGTRLAKQLKKLALGVAMARGLPSVDESVYRVAVRVALDTLPSMRSALLGQLWRLRGDFKETKVIANACELSTDTAKSWLSDLRLLGIVEQGEGERNAHCWRLRDAVAVDIVASQLWPQSQDPPPDSAPDGRSREPVTVGCKLGAGVPHSVETEPPARRPARVDGAIARRRPGGPDRRKQR